MERNLKKRTSRSGSVHLRKTASFRLHSWQKNAYLSGPSALPRQYPNEMGKASGFGDSRMELTHTEL